MRGYLFLLEIVRTFLRESWQTRCGRSSRTSASAWGKPRRCRTSATRSTACSTRLATAPPGAGVLGGIGGGRGGVERAAVAHGRAVFALARNTTEGFAVGFALLNGYLLSAGFLVVALAKPIFPDNVGVRWVNGELRGVGWEVFDEPGTVMTPAGLAW